jgi:hypothetical protein
MSLFVTVKLTRFVSEDQSPPGSEKQAWPLLVQSFATNMEDEVFVYRIGLRHSPLPADQFQCVASVNQMIEIPKNQGVTVTTESGLPFYRSREVNLICRSAAEVERCWAIIQEDVQSLVQNWNAALSLRATAFAEITGEIIEERSTLVSAPHRYQISYHPCGEATFGAGAVATATVSSGGLATLVVNTAGTGYWVAPVVTFTGGGGSGAVAKAIVSGGVVTGLQIINAGEDYASAPTVVFSSQQGLINPDSSQSGWLPVASRPFGYAVPAGAVFFYNIARDPGLAAIWPPVAPYSGSILMRNGITMPYGVTHVFTKDTVYWLDFDPATVAGYERKSPEVQDGNAPWPTNYVSRDNPGSPPPILALTIFSS